MKWREAIENGNYDPQSEDFPSRTPSPQKASSVSDATSVKVEDDDNDDIPILVVKDLARALTQIAKGVDEKYLGPPLGRWRRSFSPCGPPGRLLQSNHCCLSRVATFKGWSRKKRHPQPHLQT